ncbi:MAG: short chain dehydrogenase, partial [Pseudomonadota bacterium]
MRILLVGAHGTLGRAVAAELSARHQVIRAGRT